MSRILGISGSLRAGQVFDANGEILDESVRKQLREFVESFAAYASRPAA